MALSVETGQFAANTGSATTTVTTGFQGKAVIFWATSGTANTTGTAGNAGWSIGFSDGTSHKAIAWAGDNAVATSNVGCSYRTASALDILTNGTPTSARRITGVAFNATPNMVITWDGTPAAAYLVHYMLLGGADITNISIGSSTIPNSTGDKNIATVGFQGNFGFFLYNKPGVGDSDGTHTQVSHGYGFAVSGSKEFGTAFAVDDGATMSASVDAVGYTDSSNFMSLITAGAETIDVLGSFGTASNPTGWTSNGFDYNLSNAPAAATGFSWLVIKGGQWDLGTTTYPTSGATRTITGMAFQPKGLAFASSSPTADATVTVTNITHFGAATSTSTEAALSLFHNDAINTSVNRYISNTRNVQALSTAADFTTFNSDGWTITEASGASAAYQAGWFAMADNAVAPTTTGQGWWGAAGNQW